MQIFSTLGNNNPTASALSIKETKLLPILSRNSKSLNIQPPSNLQPPKLFPKPFIPYLHPVDFKFSNFPNRRVGGMAFKKIRRRKMRERKKGKRKKKTRQRGFDSVEPTDWRNVVLEKKILDEREGARKGMKSRAVGDRSTSLHACVT